MRGSRPDISMLAGFAVAELPLLLIAAFAGAVGGEFGATAGFVTASALVIVGTVYARGRRWRDRSRQVDDDLMLAVVTEAIFDGLPELLPHD
jgi:hypothetical protein